MSEDFDKRDSIHFHDASATRSTFIQAMERQFADVLAFLYDEFESTAKNGISKYNLYYSSIWNKFRPKLTHEAFDSLGVFFQNKGYKITRNFDRNYGEILVISWEDPTLHTIDDERDR